MTVYDYIRQRWPQHAQRIIEAAYAQDRYGAASTLVRAVNTNASHMPIIEGNVLAGLFIWQSTPEGHEYWKALAEGGEEVRI